MRAADPRGAAPNVKGNRVARREVRAAWRTAEEQCFRDQLAPLGRDVNILPLGFRGVTLSRWTSAVKADITAILAERPWSVDMELTVLL